MTFRNAYPPKFRIGILRTRIDSQWLKSIVQYQLLILVWDSLCEGDHVPYTQLIYLSTNDLVINDLEHSCRKPVGFGVAANINGEPLAL